jgi:HK97 family phage major capsid protein
MNRENLKRATEALGQVWEEYKSFRDGLGNDLSKWTPEQKRRIDAFDADISKFETEVDKVERSLNDSDRETRFNSPIGSIHGSSYGHPVEYNSRNKQEDKFDFYKDQEGTSQRHSFNRYILKGSSALSAEEYRSLTSGDDVSGGYLNAPPVFVKTMIQDLQDEVFIREWATGYNLKNSVSLGIPSLDSDTLDADWTGELSTGSEGDIKFGKRELHPHKLAKRVKVSNLLLRVGAISPESVVRAQLVAKFAAAQEAAFMTGDGVGKPLGLFTVSENGITEDRDIVGVNTATQINADTLITAAYHLKGQYLKHAKWIFSRAAISQIRKLKSEADGHYLWSPGLTGSGPTILDLKFEVSEYCPNSLTANQYCGILGDFKHYSIATGLDMQIQRLVELYAEQDLTGYIGRLFVDGMPTNKNAFVRVKMAN